jgi:hypothetical protein
MNHNWIELKSELISDLTSSFKSQSDFHINETVDTMVSIIKKEQLNEIADALHIRYIEQNFSKFDSSRTLLAGQIESYIKSVYKNINETVEGELKKCLVKFFTDFNYLSRNSESFNFFAKDETTMISRFSPGHFDGKMPFGKEFKHSYDLRNAIIHDGHLHGGEKPSNDNLPYDIRSIMVSIIFFTHKYSSKLNKVFDNQNEAFITPYLLKVISEFRKWQTKFVHTDGREDFTIMDAYAIEQKSDKGNDDSERKGTIEYLRKNEVPEKRMIIWADAGMGKSTTMQYLAYKDAIELRDKKSNKIPVYLQLKLQTDKDISIEDSIYKELSVDKQSGIRLLQKGRINLFLDGLNEILKDLREQKKREIENLLNEYPDVFITISNRPQSYNTFEKVPVFQLLKMTGPQINTFIQRNTSSEKVKKLISDQIKINKPLELMISTPLMLWMLINVVEERGDIPTSKTIIIEEFMKRIYKREAAKDSDFNIDDIDSLLRYLGAESYNINDSNAGMSRTQVEKILIKRKNDFGFNTSITYFLETTTRLNILAKDDKLYSFSHQEYQTYFAGEELEIKDFLDI